MKKTENYTVDFATETIIVSKKFLKEAGIFGSPAYNKLKDIRRDNPTFPIVVREIKKKENKKSYRNLTVDNMKTFIENCMEDGRPLKDRLAEFETVKALSKVQSSPYSYGCPSQLTDHGIGSDRERERAFSARSRQVTHHAASAYKRRSRFFCNRSMTL